MITAVEYVHAEITRLHAMLDKAIAGLTPEQLHALPGGHAQANTIAWSLFHCVRTEDNVVRFVLQDRRPTVWGEGGYAERLGLPAVAQGTGMSTADAHALRIKDVGLFQEYMRAAFASTDDFFAKAAPGSFDKVVTLKPLGDMPVFRALGQVVAAHGMMHVGQMDLARCLVGAGSAVNV
jgi:DinB superfamily